MRKRIVTGLKFIPFSYQSRHGCQQCASAVNPEPCCLGLCWKQECLFSTAGKLYFWVYDDNGFMILLLLLPSFS